MVYVNMARHMNACGPNTGSPAEYETASRGNKQGSALYVCVHVAIGPVTNSGRGSEGPS